MTRKFTASRLTVALPALALVAGLAVGPGVVSARQARGNAPAPQNPKPAGQEPRRNEGRAPGMLPGSIKFWTDAEIKKEIGLTDKQVAELEDTYQRRTRDLTPTLAEYYALGEDLNKVIAERKVSSEELLPKVVKVESLRSKINESRTIMLYRFYRSLTPDQYQKLLDAQKRRRAAFEQRNGRGRGDVR
jgi:Spy/CpxP family protein refolding chaperone